MREGSLPGLGPGARAALILLFLALEATWKMGLEGKRPKAPDLAKAARALRDGRSRFGKALRQALEENLELLLPWAPEEVRDEPPPKRAEALRRHLVRSATGYRPRDLWRELLRAVERGWPGTLGAFSWVCGDSPCLPQNPELALALIPLPAMGEAFFATVEKGNSLGSRSLLERATSALFVFGFLGYGEAFPYEGHICGFFRPAKPLHALCKDGQAFLFADRWGTLLEAERKRNLSQVRLRAYLGPEEEVLLPSPNLRSLLEGWYAFAQSLLNAYLAHGGPLYPSKDSSSGYDWDLVKEYHEAILRGLREGRCPFLFAPGAGVGT
ncbi:hypothetical protein [Thermus hydrothermalis]|uniref:hypothetical protein n=1 Tax=Thermus hydrothermalis TaxID=2908148 RepID=UPI001FA9BA81|nr:hypothetical protein [Thermus hydrothermalis]